MKKLTIFLTTCLLLNIGLSCKCNAKPVSVVPNSLASTDAFSYNTPYFTSGTNGTHSFIVDKALKILSNDKGTTVYNKLGAYKSTLTTYCNKPDEDETDYAFAYHFYNPYTKENYLPSILNTSKITAQVKFREHALNAILNYSSNRTFSMQELGRACHYLCDANVPYHSANLIAGVTAHSQYEEFVETNQSKYVATTSNKYSNYASQGYNDYCNNIIDDCAKYSYSFKDQVEDDHNSWDTVARNTVTYAEKYVAAFLYYFLQQVNA